MCLGEPGWLMIHVELCLQARGSCLRCLRKTLTGGMPTWCKLTHVCVFFGAQFLIIAHNFNFTFCCAGSSRTAQATCGVALQPKQSRVRHNENIKTNIKHVPLFEKRVILQFRSLCGVCVGGYAFMGSLIIQEVVKDLLNKGLDNAKVLLLAGSRYVHVWTPRL